VNNNTAAFLFIGLSVTLLNCGVDETSADLAGRRQAIINGTLETGYVGVGALVIDRGGGGLGLCTGTSIATDWVLTTATCVDGASASDVMFTTDSDIATATNFYNVRELHPHALYSPPDPNAGTPAENDIALVEMVGLDTANFAYNTDSQAVSAGLSILWVGYGVNSANPPSGSGVKRRGNGQIESLALTRYYYSYSGQQPCRGDSGAPAFAQIGGSQRIVGLVSSGDENCQVAGIDTRVDYYRDWINDTLSGQHEEQQPDAGVDGGQQQDDLPDAGTDAGPLEDQDVMTDDGIQVDAGQEEPAAGDESQVQDGTGPDQDQTDSSDGCSCSTHAAGSCSGLVLLALFLAIRISSRKRTRP
jgi:secreted trypsin-like serine protease